MKTLISRLPIAALLLSFQAAANFDGDGLRLVSPTPIPADGSLAQALALAPDGRFYVSGYSTSNSDPDTKTLYILRFNADGSTSPGFEVSAQYSGSVNQSARSLLVQPDGLVISAVTLANSLSPGDSFTRITRYFANGSLDNDFSTFSFDPTLRSDALDVLALQADGRILAAGSRASLTGGSDERFAVLARLNADGTLDTSFGSQGYASIGIQTSTVFFQTSYPQLSIRSVNLLEDGRIAIAGTASSSVFSDSEILLARYLSDGSPDPDFNSGEPLLQPVYAGNSAGTRNGVRSADVAPDGTWLVSVNTNAGNQSQSCLLQFNPAGALITQVCKALSTTDSLNDVQLLPTGGVVAAGSFDTSPTAALFSIYAQGLGFDGSHDEVFSSSLFRSLAVLAYDPDRNRVVVAGQGVEQVSGQNRSRWLIGQLAVPAIDVLPDTFSFMRQEGVAPNQVVNSETLNVGGVDANVRIPFRLTAGQGVIAGISISDAGEGRLGFVSPSGNPPRISVALSHTADASTDTATSTRLTLGGVVRSHNLALTVGSTRTGSLDSLTASAVAPPGGSSPAPDSTPSGSGGALNLMCLAGLLGLLAVRVLPWLRRHSA